MNTLQSHIILIIIIALPGLLISGCDLNTNNPDPADDLFELATSSIDNYTVTVYTTDPVSVGYNLLYFDVKRGANDRLSSAEITLTPLMDMGAHSHSSPVWQPGPERDAFYQLFGGAFIATMPSGDMGSWQLIIDVTDPQTGTSFSLPVDVTVAQSSRVKVFTASNEQRYILTWIQPAEPKVGSNNLIVTLHRRESMMSFPAVDDLTIEIRPWMESMGHGSNNNEHPASTGSGFYQGRVNFNMSGDWRVYFTLKDGQEDLHETWFDLMLN
jgi:hypothetical protein